MNKTYQLAGGIALIVGSVLAVAPVVAQASAQHPARVCVDNGSASQCESLVRPAVLGGSGQEVATRPIPTGRLDTKDHPNYGQITPEYPNRPDTKDHPNYGQITPEYPNRPDTKDHPNYGPSSAPGGGGGVILRNHPTNPPL